MNAAGARGEGATSKLAIVVLAHGKHRPTFGAGPRNRRHAVVGAGGQVHDHAVDVGQNGVERRRRPNRHRGRPGSANQVGQPGGPDQVVGQDRDPLRQASISAR